MNATDFASATMLRLLLRGMAAQGLSPPLPPPEGARVAHADKRRVVAAIVEQGGLSTLLALAREVRHIEGEPLHQVLVAAREPLEFMRRWQRLERYIHAEHRVLIEDAPAEGQIRLRHSGPAPQPAESLAVLGVLIGGFEALGTEDLRVQIGDHPVHPQVDEAVLATLAAGDTMRVWRLQWRVAGRPPRDRRAPADLLAPLRWPPLALALAHRQLADPAAALRLAEVAAGLGLSGRSLQRQLADHGLSFSAVIAETRSRLAAWYLGSSAYGIAEIGFLCGFADQAHFTREFSRRVGLPPARYRQAGAP